MKNNLPITKEYFIKRFTDLCLRSGLTGFPSDETAQHILLKSAALTLEKSHTFSEKEINGKLDHWITNIVKLKGIDRITLRRWLVDTGYLTRNADGSCYQASDNTKYAGLFDASVEQVNPAEAIETAREEIARRKKEFMKKEL
jgi:hypothetical protein